MTTIYYLYVKTHKKTGLKYLGKTTQKDPYRYAGSGKDWVNHLREHGKDHETTILKECSSKNELSVWGRYYSNLWNVVKSSDWANRIPETGGGPGFKSGSENPAKTEKFRKFRSASQIGSDNPKFDHTLYIFEHKELGIRETMTKYDFRKKYNLAHSHVSNLVSGYNYTKSHKGWTLVKQ